MQTKKVAIYIGKFQPLHLAHEHNIKHALNNYDHTIVLVGSINRRQSVKHPFSFQTIKSWISNIAQKQNKEIVVKGIPDYIYNEQKWIAEVESAVLNEFYGEDVEFTLIGHTKDETSYYLKEFPNFKVEELGAQRDEYDAVISSTMIREKFFTQKNVSRLVNEDVLRTMQEMSKTKEYEILLKEYAFYEKEKELFKNYPFPETLKFSCADAVVVCDGNILLIQRKVAPGEGVWALPGGFVGQQETFEEAAVRELKEETGIRIPAPALKDSIRDSKVFDKPDRNIGIPRITNAFYFQVFADKNKRGYPKLPRVKGADDAAQAKWFPLSVVKNMKLYDDHSDIISYFTGI